MLKTEFEATPVNRARDPSHRRSRTDKVCQSILFNFAEVKNRLILGLKKTLFNLSFNFATLFNLLAWQLQEREAHHFSCAAIPLPTQPTLLRDLRNLPSWNNSIRR